MAYNVQLHFFLILKLWNIHYNFSEDKQIICEHAIFEIGKNNCIILIYSQYIAIH